MASSPCQAASERWKSFSRCGPGRQLGSHSKPCALLNVFGFYDRLLGFLDFVVGEAFLRPIHRNMLLVGETPEGLLEKMERYRAPPRTRWIGRDER